MQQQADLLFLNGRVYTMDRRAPYATAVAIAGNRILAVGMDEEMMDLHGTHTRVVDLKGRPLLPGFTDSHIHLVEWALQRKQVNLWGIPTLQETLERVGRTAQQLPAGEWLRGGGWDASLWSDLNGPWPTAAQLDRVAPDRPVALDSKDLHTLWVNTRALRLAGITAQTPDPPGGVIVRDAQSGEPTGILKETARALVSRLYPPETEDVWLKATQEGLRDLWTRGITSVHIMHDREDMRNFRTLQRLREEGLRLIRSLVYFPASRLEDVIRLGLRSGFGDAFVRVGGIKFFADGTLGSQTAAMLAPFNGSDNVGVLVTPPEELYEGIFRASNAGLAVAVHAIGDRANHEVLNIFDVMRKEETNRQRLPFLPHRIEHVQLLQKEDIQRLGKLGLVASMQPIHATQDMDLARAYWGEQRSRFAYAWRSIQRHQALLVFGSDAPVEQPDVIAGIHAAITRQRVSGEPEGGWVPEERLCIRPTLHAYTLAPAMLSRTAAWQGSLYPGKVADLVVLSHDPVWLAYHTPQDLLQVHVDMTVLDGEIVYER